MKRAEQGTRNAVLVILKKPYNGQTYWLFGCKAAIYEHLPLSVVGIAKTTLQSRVNLEKQGEFSNAFCTIKKMVLHSACNPTKGKMYK